LFLCYVLELFGWRGELAAMGSLNVKTRDVRNAFADHQGWWCLHVAPHGKVHGPITLSD
jgi:hypothetical protein